MKEIKIKSAGLGITASVFAGLCGFGWWYSTPQFKNIAAILFFSSSTAGVVACRKSALDQRHVNEKIKKIVANAQKEKSDFDEVIQKSAGHVSKLSMDLQASQKQLEQVTTELQVTKVQLELAETAFKLKSQELTDNESAGVTEIQKLLDKLAATENTKDGRIYTIFAELVAVAVHGLSEFIDKSYNALQHSCDGLLVRPEYSAIHVELQKFKDCLANEKNHHLGCVRDIASYDVGKVQTVLDVPGIVNMVFQLSQQVYEEIGSLRIKFKHIRTNDERRELQRLLDMKPHLTTKKFAQDLLNEQAAYGQDTLENLKAKIEEHGEEIERDRIEFMEVLKQLEKANERVAALSQPILWAPPMIQPTEIGNIIIGFFQQQRIHLDRAYWTGDKHEATLYFHTTRINPSQRIDIKALNEHSEYLGQTCYCLKPIVFEWDWQETHLLTAKVVMLHRPEKLKAREKAKEETKNPLGFLRPSEVLLSFVRDAYHVGLWGSTGTGKSTAISNIIGGMVQELGGKPTIRATVPKIDVDTGRMFPHVDWLGIPNSIFGLLEAALEIQFRIHLNEQAFLKGEEIRDFEPTLFFIDEINAIFTRWRSVTEGDLENVLERFEVTLSGDRLLYFQNFMKLELTNYKSQFAKKLLLFVWQTGRSLRIKSLVAGQNLQPGAFGMLTNDLDNCSYVALGRSIKKCIEYKVDDHNKVEIVSQFDLIRANLEEDPHLKFTGLFCPAEADAFYSILPPPQTYTWSKDAIAPRESAPAMPLSLEASRVLDYFKSARSKKPKTLRDLKKADRLANLSESSLLTALEELVTRGTLQVVTDKNTGASAWLPLAGT